MNTLALRPNLIIALVLVMPLLAGLVDHLPL